MSRVRIAVISGAALAALAVAGAATLGLGGREGDAAEPGRSGPAATVPVTRQTLVESVSAAGELGYGATTPLASTATGTVTWLPEPGATVRRVVFAPGSVRIAERLVRVGASATGDVVSYTGSTRGVTVSTDAAKAGWARKGTKVTVTLPDGKAVPGTVSGVAEPAQPAEGADTAGSTVEVSIAIPDQKALGKLERGGVTVRYVAKERKDVLTVPVNALLALAEGGYGLEVVSDTGPRVVAVEVGLFAEGRVEVSGNGLADGALVGVPE
jgi:hypothetical protein